MYSLLTPVLPLWLLYYLANIIMSGLVRSTCYRLSRILKTRMIISQTFLLEIYLSLTRMNVDLRLSNQIHFYSFV